MNTTKKNLLNTTNLHTKIRGTLRLHRNEWKWEKVEIALEQRTSKEWKTKIEWFKFVCAPLPSGCISPTFFSSLSFLCRWCSSTLFSSVYAIKVHHNEWLVEYVSHFVRELRLNKHTIAFATATKFPLRCKWGETESGENGNKVVYWFSLQRFYRVLTFCST